MSTRRIFSTLLPQRKLPDGKTYNEILVAGTELAPFAYHNAKEGGEIMKIATSILAGLIFMSALGGIASAKAEDGVLSKGELTAGSYCHEKFPAIRPRTLHTDDPTLKTANTGDVIDFLRAMQRESYW